ncbi:MAG: biotin/lipoyl-binding protein, partial [Endozoicomonas sp.]
MADWFRRRHSATDERAFLPASVEVLETPTSPLKHILTLSICLIFILLLLWAWLGKIDVVVETQGRVIPDTHVKTVSPIQVARVQSLHVREGSPVEKGDVLIELATNPTDVESVVEQPRQEIITHQLNILRLDALLESITNAYSERTPPMYGTASLLQPLQEIAKTQQVWFPDQPNQQRWSIENETLLSELRNFHSMD